MSFVYVLVQYAPMYVKKEDVKDYIIKIRRGIGWSMVILSGTLGLIALITNINPASDYIKRGIPIPTIVTIAPIIFYLWLAYGIGSLFYFYLTSPNFTKLEETLINYKDGEMIKTSDIVHIGSLRILQISYILFFFAFIVIFYILPFQRQ